ncbi:head GIN domain-containing protein [Flavilitoribacter nigricans]|uniref:Putative auto-transporter adhesin head GIN domain-containing protein n=1 Tax=Flavilitoribacter nigricans (strain ATCC 23147 / DSM 23189 / NBRC 102662 / NCIMB 1420 / SS-2) TaxID=1122177 RepID=A0A2D0MXH2_FLAN2|nr:head GIN domain-containing protein [Flavilitoribacter nigricans]PHN00870.1 hypothetical protein CRP01_39980 [Flavilitoribacter nigricans DSM 23189 = NBRC 102662]
MKMKKTWLLLLAIVALWNYSSAQNGRYIQGEGAVVTKTLKLDNFDEIGLAVVGEVHLSKGSTQKVTVKGQANIINNLKTEVEDGEWAIEFDQKARNYEKLIFEITVPDIEGLSIAGSGSIIGKDAFNGLDRLDIAIAGSGDVKFAGSARKVSVSIAGSGNVQVENLKTEDCKVDIAGNGDCSIEVTEALSVSIAGSGDVKYKGSPRLNTSIAGSGKVRRM